MKAREFRDALARGALDRRDVSRILAGAGLGIATLPLTRRAARAEPDLTIMEWSGLDLPEFHPAFTAEHGGEPDYFFMNAEEEAFQKIRAGFQVDVSHPCTASTRRWRDAGLIEPIDTARLAHWGDILPELIEAQGVVVDGVPYMVPYDFGYSQIVYNAAEVDIEAPDYSIMIDPALAGRIAWNDQIDTAVAVGGIIAGYENIFDPSEADMAKLREVWEQAIRVSRFLWSSGTEIVQAVATGEVVATYMWTSNLVQLREQGIDLQVIPPVLPWICGFVIHADAPGSKEQAYDYVDAMLDPEAGATWVEMYGYGHANRRTYDLLDPAILDAYGLGDPVAALRQGVFFDEIPPAKREALIALWEEVQTGI